MIPRSVAPFLLVACCLVGCGGDYDVGAYNTPPVATISSPPDGSDFDEGEAITFQGIVRDDFDPATQMVVQWASDLDGVLKEGKDATEEGDVLFQTASLTPGNHRITLTTRDTAQTTGGAAITVTIVELPDAPEIAILSPLEGESANEGDPFVFKAEVFDEQDDPADLLVDFSSDLDGTFCTPETDESGLVSCEQALSVGRHLLTYTVSDTDGFIISATRYFTVVSRLELDDDGDGFTDAQGDCDDGDASIRPGAPEFWNSRDDDCDGTVDEGTEGYDDDGDGLSEADGDCNDALSSVYQGAPETYNAVDDDCDGTVDEGTNGYDDDGDGWTEVAGDCDDTYSASWPGAMELPDGKDNDCDGVVDEGTVNVDDDGDGYPEVAGDCDDANAAVSPAVTEGCNSIDDDCDGSIDEAGASGCSYFYADSDRDSFGAGAGACLCAATSTYSSALNTDCYDLNSAAYPGSPTYSTSNRGDGSYDYNCDGTGSPYYTATYSCATDWAGFSCDSWVDGWSGSTPSCGTNGTWQTGCSASWWSCDRTSSYTLTQPCQ